MRLVFCGTPDFAVPTLEAVLGAGHRVELVLTQPDRPAGRGLELQASPVKRAALQRGLAVEQPLTLKKNAALQKTLEDLRPDVILVVAYGRIIPGWMLSLPRWGNLNLHGSLLPKYRGAAPIQWAVAHGETETGVSTMQLDAGLDTGDVFLERRVSIGPETTAQELYPVLARVGSALMLETLHGLETLNLQAHPQDTSQATSAPPLTREDGRMELRDRPAHVVHARWRGFAPWPGAYAAFRGRRFLVHRMRQAPCGYGFSAGELRFQDGMLLAGAAEGTALFLDDVQLEGKPRMQGSAFAKGFQLRPGESLE